MQNQMTLSSPQMPFIMAAPQYGFATPQNNPQQMFQAQAQQMMFNPMSIQSLPGMANPFFQYITQAMQNSFMNGFNSSQANGGINPNMASFFGQQIKLDGTPKTNINDHNFAMGFQKQENPHF